MDHINNDPNPFTGRIQKCQEYIGALEEERRKIQAFERELPLCLELVSGAIERCRQQMSSEGWVLEEFIPIKPTSSNGDGQQQQKEKLSNKANNIGMIPDWLTSAQLSIQVSDPPIQEECLSKKLLGGLHHKKSSGGPPTNAAMITNCSSVETDGGGRKGEDKGQSNKKERRCWSSELHRRFLYALQQLGGAHVATPKQIKEYMKDDGLTSDEIKSHLQKYRLHMRRMNHTIHNNKPHTPQLLVVGRIWIPPLEYGTKAASSPGSHNANNAKTIYAPIASLLPSITTSLYKRRHCK